MGSRFFYPLIKGDWGDYLKHCSKNEVSIEIINTLKVVVTQWVKQDVI
jgi:hypothetical protein